MSLSTGIVAKPTNISELTKRIDAIKQLIAKPDVLVYEKGTDPMTGFRHGPDIRLALTTVLEMLVEARLIEKQRVEQAKADQDEATKQAAAQISASIRADDAWRAQAYGNQIAAAPAYLDRMQAIQNQAQGFTR